jgi:hypothetical protein
MEYESTNKTNNNKQVRVVWDNFCLQLLGTSLPGKHAQYVLQEILSFFYGFSKNALWF